MGRRLIHFEYPYVGLPALDAEQYVQGNNWLGVALSALMRIPEDRRVWLKAEALRRLVACPENPLRRFLLCEVVQAYLPLEGPQLEEFNHLLTTEKYMSGLKTQLTWAEEYELNALRRVAKKQLEKRFGPLSANTLSRLDALSARRLEELIMALMDAHSLEELGLGNDQQA